MAFATWHIRVLFPQAGIFFTKECLGILTAGRACAFVKTRQSLADKICALSVLGVWRVWCDWWRLFALCFGKLASAQVVTSACGRRRQEAKAPSQRTDGRVMQHPLVCLGWKTGTTADPSAASSLCPCALVPLGSEMSLLPIALETEPRIVLNWRDIPFPVKKTIGRTLVCVFVSRQSPRRTIRRLN